MSTRTPHVDYEEPGHAPLWWQGGDVADEEPGVRAKYDRDFAQVPKPRTAIPSRAEILARGGGRG